MFQFPLISRTFVSSSMRKDIVNEAQCVTSLQTTIRTSGRLAVSLYFLRKFDYISPFYGAIDIIVLDFW